MFVRHFGFDASVNVTSGFSPLQRGDVRATDKLANNETAGKFGFSPLQRGDVRATKNNIRNLLNDKKFQSPSTGRCSCDCLLHHSIPLPMLVSVPFNGAMFVRLFDP